MDIRQYLGLIRRQRWVIAIAVVVVTASALVFHRMQDPVYRSTATVLVQSEDRTEDLFETPDQTPASQRNIAAEAAYIAAFPVAAEAAGLLPDKPNPSGVLRNVTTEGDKESGIIEIHATDTDPARARAIVTAFARAYVENRQRAVVDGMNRQAARLGDMLTELQRQIDDLTARIGDAGVQVGAAGSNPFAQGPPGSLRAQRYSLADRYQRIFEQQQQLLIQQNLVRPPAVVLAEGFVPIAPIGLGSMTVGALGAFIGLFLGLGLGVLRDYLDDRVRGRDEVEHEVRLPVLAELPTDPDAARRPVHPVCAERPLGAVAEATRVLRTNLQFLDAEKPLRSLVVTSASPGEGKSFVALNLATVYAQDGYLTVLVSSDLRRPVLDEMLGEGSHRPRTGLTHLLAPLGVGSARVDPAGPAAEALSPSGDGEAAHVANGDGTRTVPAAPGAVDALVRTEVPGLFFLPAGVLPPNPAELLNSPRMTAVLEQLKGYADMVVLDSPPALSVADASVLAAQADAVLVVAAVGRTRRSALRRLPGRLSAASVRIVGTVVNRASGGGLVARRLAGHDVGAPAWRRRREPDVAVEPTAARPNGTTRQPGVRAP